MRIQIFITNNVIDETNYDNPVTRQVISDTHFLIDPIKAIYRTADIFLNEIEISTDEGYMRLEYFSEFLIQQSNRHS